MGEAAPGQPKKIAHGVNAQPGEGLGEPVFGIEEVEGKGGEEVALRFGSQAMQRGATAHPVPGGQERGGSGRRDSHHARQPLAFRPRQQCRSKSGLGGEAISDSRCIEEDMAFGKEEPGCARCAFGSGRKGKGDVEQGRPGGAIQGRGSDAYPDLRAGGPRLGDGVGDADSGGLGGGGGGDHIGPGSGSRGHHQGRIHKFGVGAEFGAKGQVGDQETGDSGGHFAWGCPFSRRRF